MRRRVFLFVFGLLALLGANAADAQVFIIDANPSLDRILPGIRQRHPGKFYDAQGPWRGPDGQYRYRLKWMTPDGRIVWFDADARTGRVLGPDAPPRPDPRGDFRRPDGPPRSDMRNDPRFRDDGPVPDDRGWMRDNRWRDDPRMGGPRRRR
jgi:hypothetical protein